MGYSKFRKPGGNVGRESPRTRGGYSIIFSVSVYKDKQKISKIVTKGKAI